MAVGQKSSVTPQAPLTFSVLCNFVAFSAPLGKGWREEKEAIESGSRPSD